MRQVDVSTAQMPQYLLVRHFLLKVAAGAALGHYPTNSLSRSGCPRSLGNEFNRSSQISATSGTQLPLRSPRSRSEPAFLPAVSD